MLEEQEKRFSYVAAFCLCGFTILELIVDNTPFQWKRDAPPAAKRSKISL